MVEPLSRMLSGADPPLAKTHASWWVPSVPASPPSHAARVDPSRPTCACGRRACCHLAATGATRRATKTASLRCSGSSTSPLKIPHPAFVSRAPTPAVAVFLGGGALRLAEPRWRSRPDAMQPLVCCPFLLKSQIVWASVLATANQTTPKVSFPIRTPLSPLPANQGFCGRG